MIDQRMRSKTIIFLLSLFSLISSGYGAVNSVPTEDITNCEVLIIGGTTAALGAALASASHVKTCLTEPTDWIGGQLTSEGLPAIDFAWHKVVDPVTKKIIDVQAINLKVENRNPLFTQILNTASAGVWNPGKCWVSVSCNTPIDVLNVIEDLIDSKGSNLTVFLNTVPKSVTLDKTGRNIIGVEVIKRQRTKTVPEYSFLSQEVDDWYSRGDSTYFTKRIINFKGFKYVTDASPFGDLLVLSNASFLQGIAERYDGDISGQGGSDTCGQSATFNLAEKLTETAIDDVPVPNPPNYPYINSSWFGFGSYIWQAVVTYRRVKAGPKEGPMNIVEVGDITVQNWGQGNDQKWSYILKPMKDARTEVRDWKGGLNVHAVLFAEALALEYHRWFRKNSPKDWLNRTVLSPETMNTTTALSKLPYLRDTRRSVGLDGFVLTVGNLSGTVDQVVGTVFSDRVGLGAYNVDIHGLVNCSYPAYMTKHYDILPYYIPFRALTNKDIDNLLVAGKTMATSFLANAAIRLHPEEFTSGQAAGTAMAFAVKNNIQTTRGILDRVRELQQEVKKITPISWTINGTLYPPN